MPNQGNDSGIILSSDLIVHKSPWFKWVENRLCIDCFCREPSHSARVDIVGEITGKYGDISDYSIEVYFGFTHWAVTNDKETVPGFRSKLKNLRVFFYRKKRDIVDAFKIIFGMEVYMCPEFTMLSDDAKEFAVTLIDKIEAVEDSLRVFRNNSAGNNGDLK